MVWKKRPLIIVHLLAAFLIASWFIFPSLWKALDTWAFYFFNSLISDNYYVQIFWAFCNTRMNDWLFDVLAFSFCAAYVFSSPREARAERSLQILIAFILMLSIFFINHYLFRRLIPIERLSPSLLFDGTILREVVPWLRAKAKAKKSFPGGHAITGFLFLTIVFVTTNRRWFIASLFLTIPLLIMPRLVAGAHWLSDVMLGSLLVTIVPASWIFCSPLFSKVMSYVYTRDSRPHPSNTP